jgi:hypothetical protein
LVIKQQNNPANFQRRNEMTFKKQPVFGDKPMESFHSSERVVIMEEDKESDFSQSQESLKPQKHVNN